jgi:hypothetical protein
MKSSAWRFAVAGPIVATSETLDHKSQPIPRLLTSHTRPPERHPNQKREVRSDHAPNCARNSHW